MSENEQAVSVQPKKRTIKQLVSDNYNRAGVAVGMAMLSSPVFAAAPTIDITDGKTQLAAGTVAVMGLGGAKLAPSAASWTMAMLSRAASR